jgi:GNAT superfamily N-acetyltransferase
LGKIEAMHLVLRDARDDDASQLIELIGACWSEYPGVIMDVDGEVPELRAIATAYQKRRGRFWIAEKAGRVIGSAGIAATKDPGVFELQKLYVAKDSRRQGLGARLCAVVESEARARGGKSLELWSDTRFTDAHRLYEKLGYIRGPQTRNLNDLSKTVEYYFRKDLE